MLDDLLTTCGPGNQSYLYDMGSSRQSYLIVPPERRYDWTLLAWTSHPTPKRRVLEPSRVPSIQNAGSSLGLVGANIGDGRVQLVLWEACIRYPRIVEH